LKKRGNFYVLGVVLFFEKRCQKRNRREIKKARKSKHSSAKQLNECIVEVKGSCEERQSLRAFLPMPMPFSGPLVVVWRLSEAETSDFSVANRGEFDYLYCDSVFE
jgi:hypothetical protein